MTFRRHQTPVAEPTANYYSPASAYKSMKYHSQSCSTYPKHSAALHTETPHRYQQTNAKPNKNKDYVNDAAVMKKDRYKNQQEDENNAEYIDDELGNYAEDNIEDDAEEEGTECEYLIDVFFIFFFTEFYTMKKEDVNSSAGSSYEIDKIYRYRHKSNDFFTYRYVL